MTTATIKKEIITGINNLYDEQLLLAIHAIINNQQVISTPTAADKLELDKRRRGKYLEGKSDLHSRAEAKKLILDLTNFDNS